MIDADDSQKNHDEPASLMPGHHERTLKRTVVHYWLKSGSTSEDVGPDLSQQWNADLGFDAQRPSGGIQNTHASLVYNYSWCLKKCGWLSSSLLKLITSEENHNARVFWCLQQRRISSRRGCSWNTHTNQRRNLVFIKKLIWLLMGEYSRQIWYFEQTLKYGVNLFTYNTFIIASHGF